MRPVRHEVQISRQQESCISIQNFKQLMPSRAFAGSLQAWQKWPMTPAEERDGVCAASCCACYPSHLELSFGCVGHQTLEQPDLRLSDFQGISGGHRLSLAKCMGCRGWPAGLLESCRDRPLRATSSSGKVLCEEQSAGASRRC